MDNAPIQQTVTLQQLNERIWSHLKERDWHVNRSRDLAISLLLEASELLEHYQWSDKPVGGNEAIAEELADVFIYAMQIAQQNNVDLADAIEKKLQKAAKKYPAKDFKGKSPEDQTKSWLKNKLAYKKTGTL